MTGDSNRKDTVVALVGPTGSGKTALSLALAEQLPIEIVACDSRTVYCQMDIGTAKPTPEEQRRVPHHLLDVVEPTDTYTAIQYKNEGTKAIEAILSRGRLPVICGGTGFYARVLLEGYDVPEVPPEPQLRASLKDEAAEKGNAYLQEKLRQLDPISAERINVNDRFRLVRALEVCLLTGRPFSALATRQPPPYRTLWIGLTAHERSFLYQQIKRRLDQQIETGMIEEVAKLLELFGPTETLMNTINYREVIAHIEGNVSLSQTLEDCYRHNCQLARRQLIWFRANRDIEWFDIEQSSRGDLQDKVLAAIGSKLMP